ncbi:acyclic terpene utilization AtuA family protein [Iamia majanohamensis]|uniref:Acyclic terpene utilization AtuA family protein n=1 Tax=Iamia majanohamensis TaxID=467976 RepID=A0AAE9Y7Q6_9ACTN|nr:acyclic terpene utilization AtuA family protein [Iamia majanohamensis]WCO68082.1 acyclic terpene utilization AtuA family protein [Iamia majanohamensis]
MPETHVLVPAGMLGAGFTAEAVDRGIALGAHAIAIDGGSTDSGPYYLGAAAPKMPAEAITADLRVMLLAAHRAGIPVIIGSAGTSGTDVGVDWVAGLVEDLAREHGLGLTVARIYSEQDPDDLVALLDAGRIHPLPPAGPLDAATLGRCRHVVGLMGAEPIIAALDAGVDVVVGGRATDTAVIAAVPLRRGAPAGPAWHAAKTAECGGQCTTDPRGGGVLVTVDDEGFTVEPLEETSACTPTSVAAHMIYENADPHVMREPSGTLDVRGARYRALDDRRVRVTGSTFTPQSPTVKLEGSGVVGYQSLALAGIRDPEVLASIDVWSKGLRDFVAAKVRDVLGREEPEVVVEVRCYGWDAVLGDLDDDRTTPREVGAVLIATAPDQETATKVVKLANPYLLHMPLPGMDHLPSFAFLSSPAEIPRGPLYEFLLQHVVAVEHPEELFRTRIEEVGR